MTATGMLSGRTALVTGGAQGIGLAVARAFLREGAAHVTIADVAEEALDDARLALDADAPGRVEALRLDVTDEAATEAAVDAAARDGRLDIGVANAGILVLKRAVDLSLADWRRVLDVNLTGAFVTARACGRRFVAQGGGGRLLLTSSLFGLRGGVENAAYSASKFGMIGLMQCLAAELAPHGVLVNCVCPGQIGTAMLDRLFEERGALQGRDPAELRAGFEARVPLRRLGSLDEVADTYVYLASDLARYVTGQSITVDGGWQVG